MTSNIKEVVDIYHNLFNLATTDEERQQLSAAHQLYINQLTIDQQVVARNAARPYLLNAIAMVEAMEPELQRAKEMLRQKLEQTTKQTTESAPRQ